MKRFYLTCALASIGFSFAYAAEPQQEIAQLVRQGQMTEALNQTNAALAKAPRHPQLRFLKARILAEQNQQNEAIQILTALIKDYPGQPEPYNNLAALYASQGQYEQARSTLERAIQTHPSIATAHGNLSGVYQRMASEAYQRALQSGSTKNNASLPPVKLALLTEMTLGGGTRTPASQQPALAALLPTPASKPATAVASPPQKVAAAVSPTAPKAAEKPVPAAPVAATKPTKPVEKPAVETKKGEEEAISQTVHQWAKVWSARNVGGYLAMYGQSFRPPKGESRHSWERSRKQKIEAVRSIKVRIENLSVKSLSADKAEVRFTQGYESSALKSATRKTLILKKEGSQWLIHEERVGG